MSAKQEAVCGFCDARIVRHVGVPQAGETSWVNEAGVASCGSGLHEPVRSGSEAIIHIAGQWFRIDNHLRQRCGWCGAVLTDVDLSAISVPVEQAAAIAPDHPTGGYPTWEGGALVAHDGAIWHVVEYQDGERLPAGCCARLPYDVTGLR